ncbi:MAG: hypothetical protein DRN15_09085 [Thermoprotei archaeon]|nr:MAG: hypothetical protein DRN15_09085 [Thermoprotei archaeon]
MPLTSEDIKFYYTDGATGPSNNSLSLGGTISGSSITSGVANNIFDDVTGDEASHGTIEYRAIAVKDASSSYDMLNVKVWISGYKRAATKADTIYFALENPTGSPATIQQIPDPYTAPDESKFVTKKGNTVEWTVEGSPSNTLEFGTVNAGEWFGIWLKRDVPGSASPYSDRSCTITVQCETTASPYRYTVLKTYEIVWNGNDFYVFPVEIP